TSMNGVTLISCSSAPSSSPSSRRADISSLRRPRQLHVRLAAIKIARNEPQQLGGDITHRGAVTAERAGKLVVNNDRGDRGKQADGGCQRGFGDAGGDNGKIRGLRLGNADGTVRDTPDRSEQ